MVKKHKILLVDDHTILRHGLKLLITSHGEFDVVGEAGNGIEALKMAIHLEPDIVLLDLSMPVMNGLEVIKDIKGSCPKSKVLILTVHKTEEFILAALKEGADGYVLKDACQEELILALKNVLEGRSFISPGISEKIIDGYVHGRKKNVQISAYDALTSRERQIIKLVAEGYTTKEIAKLLCISAKTADKHRENVMRKLDVHSVSALTSYAIEKKIVDVKPFVSQ